MKNPFVMVTSGALLALLLVGGCSSSSDVTMSKAQEDAIRHPVADPGYKGPDPASQAKMQQAIAAFQDKHKNDKVEFVGGGKG